MVKLRTLLSALLLICVSISWAQSRVVSGTVRDGATGETLPGVMVSNKATAKGAFTDLSGKFSIEVNSNDQTITFNLIGYSEVSEVVGDRSVIDVNLKSNVDLDEVVVTALGIPRDRKALGSATQKVDGANVSTTKEANLVNQLQGKVAGVQITGNSAMGGSARILIRGAKSITGNNQPLFIVDGVPIDNTNNNSDGAEQARGGLGYDYGNAAQDINPNDIEDIQILKGPAAALYGSRGANGVILITTKKGKKKSGTGKMPIGVTINQTLGFDKVFLLPDYQNTYGGGYGNTDAADLLYDSDLFPGQKYSDFSCDCSWGPRLDGQSVLQWYAYDQTYHPELYGKATPFEAHPDNVKDFFRTGQTSTTNVSLDGANDGGAFRLSMSNFNQKGTVENSNLNRNTVSFSGSHVLGEKLSGSVAANYVRTNGKGRPQTGYSNLASNFTQWWQRQLDIEELRDYKNPDGTQRAWNRQSESDANPLYWDNPFWTVYENYQTDLRERVYGNASMSYKVNDDFNIKGTVMTDTYSDLRQERIAVGSVSQSKYSEDRYRFTENNYELIATYHKAVGKDHDLRFLGGANRRDTYHDDIFASTQGGLNVPGFYSLQNSTDGALVTPFKSAKRVNSIFGSASYAYKGYWFVDATLRNDWSSTLPEDNNSYLYPSVSTSLVFSELVNIPKMSFGKVRASWSKVGNDTDPYRLLTQPSVGQNFGSNGMFYLPNAQNNANLRPENIQSWEVGAEMNFFVDRVHLDVTYYSSTTTDLIFNVQQSGASGYTSAVKNAGEMQNRGWEVQANFVPVRTKSGFEWNVGLNWARNRNEVKELYTDASGKPVESLLLANAPFAVTLQAIPGQPYGTIVGTDYYTVNGQRIVDGGAYVPTNKLVPLGNVMAKFTGGFNTTLSYKGLKLYTLIDFQKGGSFFSLTNTWGKYSGTLKETAENNIRENGIVLDGIAAATDEDGNTIYDENGLPVSSGKQNTTSLDAQSHFFLNGGYVIGAADVYDASFIKLREMRLTYDLNPAFLAKTPIQGMTVGVTGRNLAILHKNVPNLDPENAISSGNIQGLEGGQLPSQRNISFMVVLKF